MTQTTPRSAALLGMFVDSKLLDVHTSMPGEVTEFDAATQTVSVQPLVKNAYANPDGTELVESYPVIHKVPVQYPGNRVFFMAFPLTAGDKVHLIFNEWSIDNYVTKGIEDHPIDYQRHAFSGAVAYPCGPYPNAAPILETLDGLVIGNDLGAVIRIKDDDTIAIGSTAGAKQPIAVADDVKTQLKALRDTVDALVTAYNAHIHITTATVGVGSAGVISATTSAASAPAVVAEMGSSKVTVEE